MKRKSKKAEPQLPLYPWDECLAGSSYVGAPLKPATYLGPSESFPGWHVVVYEGQRTAMFAHTVTAR